MIFQSSFISFCFQSWMRIAEAINYTEWGYLVICIVDKSMAALHIHVELVLHPLMNADHQNTVFKTVVCPEQDFFLEIETSQSCSMARS